MEIEDQRVWREYCNIRVNWLTEHKSNLININQESDNRVNAWKIIKAESHKPFLSLPFLWPKRLKSCLSSALPLPVLFLQFNKTSVWLCLLTPSKLCVSEHNKNITQHLTSSLSLETFLLEWNSFSFKTTYQETWEYSFNSDINFWIMRRQVTFMYLCSPI